MKTIFCHKCGFKMEIPDDRERSFCRKCGVQILGVETPTEPPKAAPTVERPQSEELLKVPCVGKTIFQNQTLVIYNDHITMLNLRGDVIFNESYSNVKCCRRNDSKIMSNMFFIVLKDGTEYKFSLNKNVNLAGHYRRRFNFQMMKVENSIAGYINQLIKEYNEIQEKEY